MRTLKKIKSNHRWVLATAIILIGVQTNTRAYAEEQIGFEAVAIVEVVAGYSAKYNLGLPYSNISDCQNEISKIGLVFNNLHLQGVLADNKPIDILCEQRNQISVVSSSR